ncbi:MAG: phosphate ABC transporter permease subunit PstC [Bacteroidota bacterium]|nr:phosphate ABC transporter permease subunit PstC [Bacteroidota bacterium]
MYVARRSEDNTIVKVPGKTGLQQIKAAFNSLFLISEKNIGDIVFSNLTRLFAFILLALIVVMGYEMLIQSLPSIQKFGWKFISSSTWDPVQNEFGALPFIFGTLFSSLLALMISVFLSIGTAIFLSEFSPQWLEKTVSMLVELLAAIPSIVYGLFGIFVLAPWLRDSVQPWLGDHLGFIPLFNGAPYGFGMLAAVIILTIMILPIITSISRDIMRSIPDSQREAAFALGATKWEVVKIVLSGAKSGILGAALLGLGRAVGETMAVTMVIGNRPEVSFSLFDPGYTMASVLANEFSEATTQLYTSALVEIALLLFVLTLVLNAIARLIVWSTTKKYAKE